MTKEEHTVLKLDIDVFSSMKVFSEFHDILVIWAKTLRIKYDDS